MIKKYKHLLQWNLQNLHLFHAPIFLDGGYEQVNELPLLCTHCVQKDHSPNYISFLFHQTFYSLHPIPSHVLKNYSASKSSPLALVNTRLLYHESPQLGTFVMKNGWLGRVRGHRVDLTVSFTTFVYASGDPWTSGYRMQTIKQWQQNRRNSPSCARERIGKLHEHHGHQGNDSSFKGDGSHVCVPLTLKWRLSDVETSWIQNLLPFFMSYGFLMNSSLFLQNSFFLGCEIAFVFMVPFVSVFIFPPASVFVFVSLER